MNTITIDIETVPGSPPWIIEDIAAKTKPPGNIKKPESIDNWFKDKGPRVVKEKYASAGLDAATGEIICIGHQFNGESPKVFDHSYGNEAAILKQFFALIEVIHMDSGAYPMMIGHNLIGFDIPFIWRRAIANGIRPPICFKPPAELKAWDEGVYDTMIQWSGIRDRISLDKLSKVFGLEGKGDITGADVYPMYLEGKLDEISEYCKSDVSKTYEIYKRMNLL